jgi:hypothetical protein
MIVHRVTKLYDEQKTWTYLCLTFTWYSCVQQFCIPTETFWQFLHNSFIVDNTHLTVCIYERNGDWILTDRDGYNRVMMVHIAPNMCVKLTLTWLVIKICCFFVIRCLYTYCQMSARTSVINAGNGQISFPYKCTNNADRCPAGQLINRTGKSKRALTLGQER